MVDHWSNASIGQIGTRGAQDSWGGQGGLVIGQTAQDMGGQSRLPIGCSKIEISCLRNCRITVCDKIPRLADKLAARERPTWPDTLTGEASAKSVTRLDKHKKLDIE